MRSGWYGWISPPGEMRSVGFGVSVVLPEPRGLVSGSFDQS